MLPIIERYSGCYLVSPSPPHPKSLVSFTSRVFNHCWKGNSSGMTQYIQHCEKYTVHLYLLMAHIIENCKPMNETEILGPPRATSSIITNGYDHPCYCQSPSRNILSWDLNIVHYPLPNGRLNTCTIHCVSSMGQSLWRIETCWDPDRANISTSPLDLIL